MTTTYRISQINSGANMNTEIRRQATVIGDEALWSLRHGWRAEIRRTPEWSSDWISVTEVKI